MARDSDPIIFSTDGSHRSLCPTCGRTPCVCPSPQALRPADGALRMRLERKGRGGKAVTVVFDLPPHGDSFAGLLKKLKAHCGTGGALKEGRMEIQGDQRDRVQAFLEQAGFTVRRSGG